MSEVSEQIIFLRKTKKISQAKLAKVLGISRGYYIRMESNDDLFTKKRIKQIGEYFGKKVLILFIDE